MSGFVGGGDWEGFLRGGNTCWCVFLGTVNGQGIVIVWRAVGWFMLYFVVIIALIPALIRSSPEFWA